MKPLHSRIVGILARSLAGASLLAFFLSLSLPIYVDLALLLILVGLVILADTVGLILISGSCFVAGIGLHLALPLFFRDYPFYREHEMYARGSAYEPNVNTMVDVLHGDLASIDPTVPLGLREPRRIKFVTDSRGFRNEREYDRDPIVLVGDSFVVANGNDQSAALHNALRRKFQLRAYNLGYPSDPSDYFRVAGQLMPEMAPEAVFAFFFYEGNDFTLTDSNARSPAPQVIDPEIASFLNAYDRRKAKVLAPLIGYSRWMSLLGRRAERSFFQREDTSVSVYDIGGKAVAFLDGHTRVSFDRTPRLSAPFPRALAARTACVFFIPGKFRVYAPWIPERAKAGFRPENPAADTLRHDFGELNIPVVDLTPDLQEAARTLLPSGEFVFWRDDTHLNDRGLDVIASPVAECLRRRTALTH
jgi:SGNH hydrolase-like domain, acetyltransferase AlgX